jgi:hypothetical protein
LSDIITNCQHHYDDIIQLILIHLRNHEYTSERWSDGEEGEGSGEVVDEDEDGVEEERWIKEIFILRQVEVCIWS